MPVENLPKDAIDIWLAPTALGADQTLRKRCEALLDRPEQQRLQKLRLAKVRDEYLCTRALVRTTLSRYSSGAPQHWHFAKNAHGRPYLSDPIYTTHGEALTFNVSHSGHWIAMGVRGGSELGVDIEFRKRQNQLLAIAKRFFSPTEFQALMRLPQHRRHDRFFVYWTLKEAYIKARGMGLALPLAEFTLECDHPPRSAIRFTAGIDDDPQRWSFFLYQPDRDHQLAICAELGQPTCRIRIRKTGPINEQ